jgi:hypothetical protein
MDRKPNTDEAQAMRDAAESVPSCWKEVREHIPSTRARAAADAVVAAGGLSLLDIQGLEYADHMFLTALMAKIQSSEDAKGKNTLLTAVIHARLQSRKHLRTIAHLINPTQSVLDVRPEVPEDMAAAYELRADDFGDDLVN